MLVVVDASALYAATDADDVNHMPAVSTLGRPELTLVIPVLIVAEAAYLISRRIGAGAEAGFLASLAQFEVEAPLREEWVRIAELVYQYRNFPLGGADASVIALAERLGTDVVMTFDRRHFAAVRPRHVPAFRIFPE